MSDPLDAILDDDGPAPDRSNLAAYYRKEAARRRAAAKPKAKKYADPLDAIVDDDPAPRQDMVMLPDESELAPVSLDLKGKREGVVPKKRARADFTDITPSGTPGLTAEELGGAKEDESRKKGTAFIGGTLQGATFGLGDEAAALFSDKPYAEAREENRRAFRDAQAMDPKSYAMGHITGAAAMIPATPSLAPVAGKSLVSAGNMARAAAAGGIQGLGESEADLTKGDLYGAAKDTAKGAAVAAGASAALGLAGKGYRAGKRFIESAPERVASKADDALIDAATLGAPASQRDALSGELGSDREGILGLIKSNPELRKAIEERRYTDAAIMARQMQAANKAAQAGESALLDSGARKIDVAPLIAKREERLARLKANPSPESQAEAAAEQKRIDFLRERYMPEEPLAFESTRAKVAASPIVKRLEERRDRLAANPAAESQAEAAKTQKLIDHVKERWIPEPKPAAPKGNELLGKLMDGADAGDKQRAGSNAKEFLKVAKEYKMDRVANDDAKTLEAANSALSGMDKERASLYGQLGEAAEIPLGNVTGKLAQWKDELARSGADVDDVPKVEALIENIWKAHGKDGKSTISAEELRNQISKFQKKGFSGSYLDPNKSAEMGRAVASKMREAFDEHVAKVDLTLPRDSEVGRKIADLNRRYSPMIAFRDAAEKRAAAGALKPPKPPETRTGWAPTADAVAMANATKDAETRALMSEELSRQLGAPVVNPNRGRAAPSEIQEMIASTKDPDIKRELTGEFYSQIGTGPAHRLTALEDEGARMSRLEAPLTHLAERGSTPPTTLRSHGEGVRGYLERGGVAGGLALMVSGHAKEGAAMIAATLATKYGIKPVEGAEREIAAMVAAARLGAYPDVNLLRSLAKHMKMPREMAEDLISSLAPREYAANKNRTEKK